VPTYLHQ